MSTDAIIPGLRLFTSNRMETLAQKLAERLALPLPSALATELVVVRNKGMERWLRLELAERHGICANCQFPFPEAFGYRVFHQLMPGLPERPALDRNALLWRILAVLPSLLDRPEFAPLRHYLEGEADARKPVQLAGRIAHLFDQYLIFRPAQILDWEAGAAEPEPEARWQPMLWRAVVAGLSSPHAATLYRQFGEIIQRPLPPHTDLPPRVSIFGLSALPPYYLGIFSALARHLQVSLFLLQPSQEYWGDITSAHEQERILRSSRRQEAAASPDRGRPATWPSAPALDGSHPHPLPQEEGTAFQLHLDSGNRLLASLGYLGRDFLKLVLEAGDWMTEETFVDPGQDTLLHCLQSDILHLRDRGAANGGGPPDPNSTPDPAATASPSAHAAARHEAMRQTIEPGDDSIQVHSCHSALRELEVLYDHMLTWFDRDPTLTPRDIVVMTPDIEAYAPLVAAVFGAPEESERFIPFSVADRAGRRQSQVIDTYLNLLDLAETRLGPTHVLDLLEAAPLRDKFELADADLPAIRRWIEETNIRWGMDAAHRQALQLPAMPGNTWREGLDRLLLGYAMSGVGRRSFHDVLPHQNLDGSQVTMLGRFLDFLDRLFGTVADLQQARPIGEWMTRLRRILDEFFQTSEAAADEEQMVRDALTDLAGAHAGAGFVSAVPLSVVRDRLGLALEEDLHPAGFLTGGVTFCGLKPMRSIPFRIICLVGMNDGAFPRPTYHLGFDLMAKNPRLGDRSTREDDRYLFLETLLSARERLYLSYVGQSIRDNSEAPPSVLMSELLDCIEAGFTGTKAGGPAAPLITRHRLQAFSEEYFRPGGRLFSHSIENSRASAAACATRTHPQPEPPPLFCQSALSEPEARFREVSLDNLGRFLTNPARFFLQQRLNVRLTADPAELEEREPFVLGQLEDYKIKGALVEGRLGAPDDEDWLRFSGRLPLGTVGDVELRRVTSKVERFVELLQRHRPATRPPHLDLELALGGFQLRGRIPECLAAGPLYYRCAARKPRDLLLAWVLHLAANCVETGRTTTLITEDGVWRYGPPANPAALLEDLLALYWQGLSAPLKFFPEAALEFAAVKRRQDQNLAPVPSRDHALRAARRRWEGTSYSRSRSRSPSRQAEREDASFALCFREQEPIDEEFAALAERVFGPVLLHETKEAD